VQTLLLGTTEDGAGRKQQIGVELHPMPTHRSGQFETSVGLKHTPPKVVENRRPLQPGVSQREFSQVLF
jgi:hypothetical protein